MPRTPSRIPLLTRQGISRGLTATIAASLCAYGHAYASCTTTTGSSQNINKLTGLLQNVASLMSGEWFKLLVIIGMAIAIGLLIFDGANLGQGVKNLLSVIAIVLVFFFIISLIMGANPSTAIC